MEPAPKKIVPKIRILNENEQSDCGSTRSSRRSSSVSSTASGVNNDVPGQKRKGGGEASAGTVGHHQQQQQQQCQQQKKSWLTRKLSFNEMSLKQPTESSENIRQRKFSLVESLSADSGQLMPVGPNNQHRGSIQSNTSSSKAKLFKSRASELIIRIPTRQLQRIARAQGIGSLQRETQHFVGVTSINGLLRIYRSRGVFRLSWILVTCLSLSFLIWQICKLGHLYRMRPTVSQVSFLLPENGLPFPAVTICNHSPIRRGFVESLNKTGRFSHRLLDYAMFSFMDPQYLLSIKQNPMELEISDEEWKAFVERHAEHRFTVNGFFWNASASCQQMLKFCSFGGREFDCCKYAKGILTDIGKCYQLYFGDTDQSWLKRQVQAGISNGLQIIADAHTEEQISTIALYSGHAFANNFENGFRYYVHDQHAMPFLSTEGISVSPGTKVYSAISPTKYVLLSQEEWGNCTHQWPDTLQSIVTDGIGSSSTAQLEDNVPYTSLKCKTLCQAKFFYEQCGCSPFIYNIEEYYQVCTPYETFKCLNSSALNPHAAGDGNAINSSMEWPTCTECKIECHRSVYHIYNSYSQGFARAFLRWLHTQNGQWSPGHVRSNFVSMNIFYRDMCYTEYKQVQSVTMTEILSDIGGNMGLFLGMSLISLIELGTFLCKLTWLFISKQRREHMLAKKCRDDEREKRLQATLEFAAQQRKFASGIGRMMSQVIVPFTGDQPSGQDGQTSMGGAGTGGPFRRLRRIASSTRRKATAGARIAPLNDVGTPQHQQLRRSTAREFSVLPADAFANGNNKSSLETTRQRSSSVFSKLFSSANNLRRPSATSTSSQGPKAGRHHRKKDFVDSVIESRLHGDAGRAARRHFSTSSSSTDSHTCTDDEEANEGEDKLVELKIDLDAFKYANHAKNTLTLMKPIHRRKSASAMRTKSVDVHQQQQAQVRRANTFAYPNGMAIVRRSSADPPSGLQTLSASNNVDLEAQQQQSGVPKSPSRRPSIVSMAAAAIFGGNSLAKKESDPEAPKLSQIAQKYSMSSHH